MADHSAYGFCPNCGSVFRDANEFYADIYWQGKQTVTFYWCRKCLWRGEVTRIENVTTTEPDE